MRLLAMMMKSLNLSLSVRNSIFIVSCFGGVLTREKTASQAVGLFRRVTNWAVGLWGQ
jgi:hypothetical protein